MQISPINYSTTSTVSRTVKNTKEFSAPKQIAKPTQTSFKGWNVEALRILERTEAEMYELGKAFHNCSDSTLLEVSRIYNFFGFKKRDASVISYGKLKCAVGKVLERKRELLSKIAFFEKKGQLNMEEENQLNILRKEINDINKASKEYLDKYLEKADSSDPLDDPVTLSHAKYD